LERQRLYDEMNLMPVRLIQETDIRKSVTLAEAITAMEEAFVAYSYKKANVPPVVHLDVPEREGEVHIKGAYIHGAGEYVIKVASGFFENSRRGLPVGSGLMLVFSSETGYPEGILLDNGYLTELRTAAAGAVAAKYMANKNVEQVAILGAGSQGRFQLEALAAVRDFRRVKIYDHRTINITNYLNDMNDRVKAILQPANTVSDAIDGSSIIITATTARKPLVRGEWIHPGMHITAVGSDDPEKQELDADVFGRVDRVIADSISQCVRLGEIHHAIEHQTLREADIDGELGQVIAGDVLGRQNEEEITLCDLTGVGVQDAAIAGLVFRKAKADDLGKEV